MHVPYAQLNTVTVAAITIYMRGSVGLQCGFIVIFCRYVECILQLMFILTIVMNLLCFQCWFVSCILSQLCLLCVCCKYNCISAGICSSYRRFISTSNGSKVCVYLSFDCYKLTFLSCN